MPLFYFVNEFAACASEVPKMHFAGRSHGDTMPWYLKRPKKIFPSLYV